MKQEAPGKLGTSTLQDRGHVSDLAILTAILYAARLQRRVPETDAEKCRAIAESIADAKLIVTATTEDEEPDIRRTLSRLLEEEPEQPPPSPGNKTGVFAEARATRRRG